MRIPTTRITSAVLVSIVLGASLVLAWVYLLCVIRFDVAPSGDGVAVRNDFVAIYAGAQFAARGQTERSYDLEALHALEKEITGSDAFPLLSAAYPPFFHLVAMPLASLDARSAYRVWAALTGLAVLGVALLIAPRWLTVLLVPIFPAVAFSAAAGQNGNLSAALVGAGLLLLPRRPVAAGIAFGLMAYKPQLALAIPFCLLAGRHYRALAATAATAGATVIAALVAFGPAPILSFLPNIATQAQRFFGDRPHDLLDRMPTVMAKLVQLTDLRPIAWAAHVAVAVLALAWLVRLWRRSTEPVPRALALAAAMPLLTPYYFDYDLAVMIVPFAFLLREMHRSTYGPEAWLPLAALWLAQPVVTLLPAFVGVPWTPAIWMYLLAWASWSVARPGMIPLRARPS